MECYVCNLPGEHESHHIVPLHLGGPKDGPQVNLCEICHHKLHLISNDIYKGRTHRVEQFSNDELKRASLLIRAIVSAKIAIEGSGKPPNAIQRLMLEIPYSMLTKLHLRKADLGFSSLNAYLMTVLTNEVNKL